MYYISFRERLLVHSPKAGTPLRFIYYMILAGGILCPDTIRAQVISGWQGSIMPKSINIYNAAGQLVNHSDLSSQATYFIRQTSVIHLNPCGLTDSMQELYISQILQSSSCPAWIADTARLGAQWRSETFFKEGMIKGSLRAVGAMRGSVAKSLAPHLGACHSMVDSVAVVANFIHYAYPYDDPNRDAPEDPDSAYYLLRIGHLWGNCGNTSHYFSIIQQRLFPWWGYSIELTSTTDTLGSDCCVSHTFVGLSDHSGHIFMIVDPTVNGVWTDAHHHPLSLDSLRQTISRGQPPAKTTATVYGSYHPEPLIGITESDTNQCEWSVMFNVHDSADFIAYQSLGTRDTAIAWGPLRELDDRDPVHGRPDQDYYWEEAGIPRSAWGWWCVGLFIWQSSSVNAPQVVKDAITSRYGFPVF